jgi:two-component system, OmpR family, sensor histidine kinase TctE
MNLAARLLEWLVAPLLSIWLVSLGISLMSARNTVDTILDDGLSSAATVLMAEWQARATTDGTSKFPSDATRLWMTVARDTPITYLIVDDANVPQSGDPDLISLLRETADADHRLPAAPVTASVTSGTIGISGTGLRVIPGFNTVLDDDSMRVVRTRFSQGGRNFVLGVVQSRERHAALFRVGTLHEILAQSATLLVAFFLLWYGLSYVGQPLKALKTYLDERGAEDLRPLPEQLAPQEIAPLIGSVNALMARLQASFAAQKRFIANAAHQLRTPLAALQAQSELLQHMPDGTDREQSLKRLTATGQRASHLATQLLTLVRAESAGTTSVRLPVDLNALCEAVALDVIPQALAREIDFALEIHTTPVEIVGDATLLGEMIRNLLDNAFKYTPIHGSVTLTVRADPPTCVVDDSGPGVLAHDHNRIFAPFARVALTDAHTGAPIPGTGLGLAIVREVADAHQASVHVERSTLGGARFVVSFTSVERQSSVSGLA